MATPPDHVTPTPPDGVAPALPDGVAPAFARSVRLWARAYPRRWRAARGAELLGLLADLSAPQATRLDARSVFDLVRAGWATRLREHPPVGPWLAYRIADRRLRGHLAWVKDDIDGRGYSVRYGFSFVAVFLLATALLNLGEPASAVGAMRSAAIICGGWLVVSALQGSRLRRQARERHLVPRAGEPVLPGSLVSVPAPRRRLAARAGLPAIAVGLVLVLGACVVAAALAPTTLRFARLLPGEGVGVGAEPDGSVPRLGLVVGLVAALAMGVALAFRARRRMAAPQPVAQPHRVLVEMRPRTLLGALLTVVAAATLPVAEMLGAVPLAFSVPIGLAAGVLSPPAFAAWAAVRRAPVADDLAAIDVWRVALTGRPPRVDEPTTDLVPADGALVGTIRPWPWSNEGPTAALG